MSTLTAFSEKDREYFKYQARQEYLREQRKIQLELEEAAKAKEEYLRQQQIILQELEASKHREEKSRQEAQAAQAEIERLKMLLAQKPS